MTLNWLISSLIGAGVEDTVFSPVKRCKNVSLQVSKEQSLLYGEAGLR